GALDPAMLITQRDFQVKDVLAMTLKTKVAGLDDAGVHRSHSHLMDFFALDTVEVRHTGDRRLGAVSIPGIMAGQVRSMKPDWLEPGMAVGAQSPLLRDLALEPVRLRTL